MADLIDRTALLEQLDDLHNHCGHCDGYGYISKDKAMQKVKAAPAVDAVEVVRCKDCKHLRKDGAYIYCGRFYVMIAIRINDYCSYGERRTDATDIC